MALPPTNHYLARFSDGGSTKSVEVFGKDEADAKKKLLLIYPAATSITISGVS